MCTDCRRRESCVVLCEKVERLLPHPDKGKIRFNGVSPRETLSSLYWGLSDVRVLTSMRDILSGRRRQIFDLRYNDGLSFVEIARRLSVSETTVRYHLRKAVLLIGAEVMG